MPYLHHLSHELDQDQNEAGPSRRDTLRDQMDSLKVQQEDDTILEHSKLYKEIEEFCRLNNTTFVDDSFPHSMRSIGPISLLEEEVARSRSITLNSSTVVWLRPQQIVTKDGFSSRWAVFNDPNPTDIEQGLLGNCWFISALAVVAERPDLMEKLIISKTYNHLGIYELRLCVDGIWESIVIDDFFPCHKRTKSMVFAIGRKNQLWVSLIEKGLAKIYGNYVQLRAGRTVEGLSTLTGAPTLYIDLEEGITNSTNASSVNHNGMIWAQLLSSREAGFLMGCSCGAGKRAPDEAEFRRVGLMPKHAYSILDVREIDNQRLLRLRNPWGSFIWLGEWSWDWPGWNAQRKSLVGRPWRQSGTFWIPFERFLQYFDSVDIAQIRIHNGWTSVRYPIKIGWDGDGKPTKIVRITVTEATEVCILLHQRYARTALDQIDLLVTIHYEEPGHQNSPGELVFCSKRCIKPFVRTEDIFLKPGEYIVCAHSFSRFAEGKTVPGAIAIHSSKRLFTEAVDVPLDSLQKSIYELVLKEGIVHTLVSPAITRYLMDDFEGLLMVVENPSPNRCIQVLSDCSHSTNVLSSRCGLVIADSIPPMHRQITLLLTHFEHSQPFNILYKLQQRMTAYPALADFAPSAPNAQNYPALGIGTTSAILHFPRPLYT